MPAVIGSGPTSAEVTGGGSTLTIATPPGTAAGELLLALVWCDNDGSAAAITAPADAFNGWTLESTSSTTVSGLSGFAKIFTKRLSSQEAAALPASYVFGVPSAAVSDSIANLWRYLGVDPTSPFAARPAWANPGAGSTTALVAPSIQPPVPGLLMAVWMIEGLTAGTGTITGPGGMSYGSVQTTGGFLTIGQGSTVLNPQGPTGTRTGTASGGGSTGTQGYLAVTWQLAEESTYYAGPGLGPPPFGRPWQPVPFVPVLDTTEIQNTAVRPAVANAPAGLSATAATSRVSAVAARAALGLTGQPSARKLTPAATVDALGVAASAVARKAAPATGRVAAGVTALGTARKVSTPSAAAPVGLSGASTARKLSAVLARSAAGLQTTGTARKLAATAGQVALGLSSTVQRGAARAVAALAGLGLAGSGPAAKRSTSAAASQLGLTSVDTARKLSTVTARSTAGTSATGGALKRSTATVASGLGLAASASRTAARAITAIASAGLVAASAASRRSAVTGQASAGLSGQAAGQRRTGVTATAAAGLAARAAAARLARSTARAVLGLAGYRVPPGPPGGPSGSMISTQGGPTPGGVDVTRQMSGGQIIGGPGMPGTLSGGPSNPGTTYTGPEGP